MRMQSDYNLPNLLSSLENFTISFSFIYCGIIANSCIFYINNAVLSFLRNEMLLLCLNNSYFSRKC